MKKEMLINVLQPEECRIAIIEDGILEELYVERTSHESYTGNIYKGKIVNLEPAIQAAFVDFSVGRNGFLHVSDVEPQYYHRQQQDDLESAESKIEAARFTDNPGRPGKSQVRLVDLAPQNRSASCGEAKFTSSSGGVRTPSNANEELGSEKRLETASS